MVKFTVSCKPNVQKGAPESPEREIGIFNSEVEAKQEVAGDAKAQGTEVEKWRPGLSWVDISSGESSAPESFWTRTIDGRLTYVIRRVEN